jgi:hypothetical protein
MEAPAPDNAAAAIDTFLAFKAQNPVKQQRINIKELIEDGRA